MLTLTYVRLVSIVLLCKPSNGAPTKPQQLPLLCVSLAVFWALEDDRLLRHSIAMVRKWRSMCLSSSDFRCRRRATKKVYKTMFRCLDPNISSSFPGSSPPSRRHHLFGRLSGALPRSYHTREVAGCCHEEDHSRVSEG